MKKGKVLVAHRAKGGRVVKYYVRPLCKHVVANTPRHDDPAFRRDPVLQGLSENFNGMF